MNTHDFYQRINYRKRYGRKLDNPCKYSKYVIYNTICIFDTNIM